jgi:hypothetical protein
MSETLQISTGTFNTKMRTGLAFPQVKRQERVAEHSPQCNTETKNGEAVLPLLKIFMVRCLIN